MVKSLEIYCDEGSLPGKTNPEDIYGRRIRKTYTEDVYGKYIWKTYMEDVYGIQIQ